MAFLKLRCETAYATGAVRTNLGLHDFARKLTRVGLPAKVSGGQVYVKQDGHEWIFGDWEHDGLGQTGWLRFTTDGDVGSLSRVFAKHGVRHKLDHSRPLDLTTDDIRCVTQYDYKWTGVTEQHLAGHMPNIETFEECV
ncbi:MAG: hypothetical protein ABL898_07475 [Hyphomicrobiaceae bacterium]